MSNLPLTAYVSVAATYSRLNPDIMYLFNHYNIIINISSHYFIDVLEK